MEDKERYIDRRMERKWQISWRIICSSGKKDERIKNGLKSNCERKRTEKKV